MKIKSLVLALFLMIPLTAFAGECDTDEDCPDGSFCIFGPTEACACIPCAEGEECPPCDCPEQGQAEGFCESHEIDFGEK